MSPGGRVGPIDTTGLATSGLVEDMPFPSGSNSVFLTPSAQKPVENLRERIEQLHFNITVGLLSLGPALLYAANGTAEGVEVSTTEIVWVYEPLVLGVVYLVAAVVDILVVVVGVWAMRRNGGVFGMEVGRVVALMKGVEVGTWEGWDPIPKRVDRVKVGFERSSGGFVVKG